MRRTLPDPRSAADRSPPAPQSSFGRGACASCETSSARRFAAPRQVLFVFLLASLLGACSGGGGDASRAAAVGAGATAQGAPHGHGHGHGDAGAADYKAGRGLRLTKAAEAFVGLQTAEVGLRSLRAGAEVPAIPAAARLRTLQGDCVFVANGEWFLRTPVVLGPEQEGWHEVLEGLYEGDRVVTGGVRALRLAEIQAVNGGVGCADGH